MGRPAEDLRRGDRRGDRFAVRGLPAAQVLGLGALGLAREHLGGAVEQLDRRVEGSQSLCHVFVSGGAGAELPPFGPSLLPLAFMHHPLNRKCHCGQTLRHYGPRVFMFKLPGRLLHEPGTGRPLGSGSSRG